MNEIRRIGPARAVDTRGTAIRVAVPLNESPSPEWVHFFQDFPKEFTTIAHPKFVDIELTRNTASTLKGCAESRTRRHGLNASASISLTTRRKNSGDSSEALPHHVRGKTRCGCVPLHPPGWFRR